ncbi:hypothetical protein BC332_01134 [Capsicum chinense]|nr:hypothetical protein BC332_01134 [Capsicum chinense]
MGWGLCSGGEDEVIHEHDLLGRDIELFCRHLYGDGKPKPTSKGVVGAELVDGLIIQEGQLIDLNIYWFTIPNIGSVLKGLP